MHLGNILSYLLFSIVEFQPERPITLTRRMVRCPVSARSTASRHHRRGTADLDYSHHKRSAHRVISDPSTNSTLREDYCLILNADLGGGVGGGVGGRFGGRDRAPISVFVAFSAIGSDY
jgi:hypothetical protein